MLKILSRFILIFTMLSLFTNSFAAVAETSIIGKTQLELASNRFNSQTIDYVYLAQMFKDISPEKEAEFKQFQIEYPNLLDLKLPKIQIENRYIYFFIDKEKVRMTFDKEGGFEVFYKNKSVKLSSFVSIKDNYRILKKTFSEDVISSFMNVFIDSAYGVGIEFLIMMFTVLGLTMAFFIHLQSVLPGGSKPHKQMVKKSQDVCDFTNKKYINMRVDIERMRSEIPHYYNFHCQGKNISQVTTPACVQIKEAIACLESYTPISAKDNKRDSKPASEKEVIESNTSNANK